MNRREFVALGAASPLAAMADSTLKPKLGIDLFSLRTQKWTPIQYLDYCAARHVQVVHFSEVRFIGSLEPENLRKVREHAGNLGIEIEIGMRSICPSSTMFDASQGTAEEQLNHMIDSASIVGSRIVRAVLGSAEDRKGGHIE
ncbi:MAG: sugar phosphate isomerase/epimerase, partial [Bryobacteraceae bacterium]